MTQPDAAPSVPQPEIVQRDATTTAVVRGVVPVEELAGFFDSSFSRLPGVLADQGVTAIGPAFALYRSFTGQTADLEVGFPTGSAAQPVGDVEVGSLPGGSIARLLHHGAFDQLSSSWERLRSWIGEQGRTPRPEFWEVYVTEPSPDMDPAELVTELCWPLAD